MKQIRLAEKAEITAQHVTDLKRGRKNMTPKMADKFEAATGISKLAWLFPGEKYGDPWAMLKELPS